MVHARAESVRAPVCGFRRGGSQSRETVVQQSVPDCSLDRSFLPGAISTPLADWVPQVCHQPVAVLPIAVRPEPLRFLL